MSRARVFLFLLTITCLGLDAVDASGAKIIALVSTGEMFASHDGGATWSLKGALPVSDVVAVAAGETSDELFLATRSGVVFRSGDAGSSWTASGSVAESDVVDMAIRSTGHLFLLSAEGTLYRSFDDAATFTPVASLTASNHVSLEIDAAGEFFALTQTGEVARSTDFGVTWHVVGAVTAPDAVALRAMGTDLYVLTGTGVVARSGDHAATWLNVGTVSQVHMVGLTVDGADLVATSKEGLVATSSDAVAWSFVGSVNQQDVMVVGTNEPKATGIGVPVPELSALRVRAAWPNPAHSDAGAVTVSFEMAKPGRVALRVHDVAGRLVDERTPQEFSRAGEHVIRWSAGGLTSGIYFVQLVTEDGLTAHVKIAIVD